MLSHEGGDISQQPTERTLQRITALHTLLGYEVRVSHEFCLDGASWASSLDERSSQHISHESASCG